MCIDARRWTGGVGEKRAVVEVLWGKGRFVRDEDAVSELCVEGRTGLG